jgi:hypothetical protein
MEMIEKNDTHFYVGTIHGHPHVCDLPPKTAYF